MTGTVVRDTWWFDEPPGGINRWGEAFEQVFTVYPWTKQLYTGWELRYNRYGTVAAVADMLWPWFPIACCGLYLLFIFVGVRMMSSRKAWQVRPAWRCWNLGLSIFSLVGAVRTVPHLAMLVLRNGIHNATCAIPTDRGNCWGIGVCGLWVMLFVLSKIPELGDTVFIVLGKKKLLFLHWYHHVTVLLFCWHSFSTRSSSGLWFTTLNYSVHTIMYFYYFLASFRHKSLQGCLAIMAPVVTCLQILQMFAGIAVLTHVYRIKATGGECHTDTTNMWYGILMYASYAVLFIVFAAERYCPCWKRSASKAEKGRKAE
mmetsp:Transcript_58285/g.138877  ORF Transcript_58285/g.138877 Transcript_58285/m.138877 type:complete len:315 (+) Transcript_58285:89-1033(+)|eukprot:CAMPEP_0178424294 /NCGR_PEP_ID=MMETSP0689_2-20121128/28134_1 /TAXON_ID=160604 /ORGANISM="Amphidinium massartii, Strain CS-259" /LENGTH=314 /DNA_ID=CAMNT_0020045923 /DNA_START=44 /DNA_END=988 /DNA_ORIENTATION=+